MTTSPSPVRFISGCSSGFGREIGGVVLDRGLRATHTGPERCKGLATDFPAA